MKMLYSLPFAKDSIEFDVDGMSEDELLKQYETTVVKAKKKQSTGETTTNIEFIEHEACWDLYQRGGVGETPLHLCVLFSNLHESFREIAKILLKVFPKLSRDIYEDDEYYGELCIIPVSAAVCYS
jgi:hypothetical protein